MRHDTILYGGAFDPPQLAHTAIATQIGRCFNPDRLVLVPSGANEFKSFRTVDWFRRKLIDIFSEEVWEQFPRTELSIACLDGSIPETTTLAIDEYFRRELGHSPTQVFGTDVIPHMISWDPTGYVAHELPKIFIARPGYAPDMSMVSNYEIFAPEVSPDVAGLSSSEVRANIKNRVFRGISPRIEACIRDNNLYQ